METSDSNPPTLATIANLGHAPDVFQEIIKISQFEGRVGFKRMLSLLIQSLIAQRNGSIPVPGNFPLLFPWVFE